jgi:ribosomal protein S8
MNLTTKNLLLSLRNNSIIKKNSFRFKLSKQNLILLELLYNQGLLQSYLVLKKSHQIHIFMRYFYNKSTFYYLKFLSSSFDLTNSKFLEISKLFNKRYLFCISTDKGLCTSYFCKRNNIGGKLLFLC